MSGAAVVTRVPGAVRTPVFNAHRCKQCGLCTYVCPTGILELSPHSAPTLPSPEGCSGCRNCEFICPDFAVTMTVRALAREGARPAAAGSRRGDTERPGDAGAAV